MRKFVKEIVWKRLKNRQDMFCGCKKRPIMALNIYTKNRLFRVPGSSIGVDTNPPPMPSEKFFMESRMADRDGKPEVTAHQIELMLRGQKIGTQEIGMRPRKRNHYERSPPSNKCNAKTSELHTGRTKKRCISTRRPVT